MTRVAILGTGGWGTALGVTWTRAGVRVRMWTPFEEEARTLQTRRENPLLRGVALPGELEVGNDLAATLQDASVVVFAVPAKHMASTATAARAYLASGTVAISVAKGLAWREGSDASGVAGAPDPRHPARMTEVLRAALGSEAGVAALSGPSHAEEVGRGLATTVVVAGDRAEFLRDHLSTPAFRIYTSPDLAGVELGGALKNPIAIAAGIAAGLGLGDNAMGALVTRGIAEITRLGAAVGADPRTFAGLSGIGDLVTTCISAHSRNRRVGIALAQGQKIDVILKELGMVAEGVESARVADAWGRQIAVETPIISAVARVIFDDAPADRELQGLMTRSLKNEF